MSGGYGTPAAWEPPASLSEEERRILDVLWARIPEDVKFQTEAGLTVAPRAVAEDRARRAFGPFRYGLRLREVQEVFEPGGRLAGIRVLATFWARLQAGPLYQNDVVGWYSWEQRPGEAFAEAYNRAVKAARGDALKQGLFALGFGWDLRGNGDEAGNGAPARRSEEREAWPYEVVVTDFAVRRPGAQRALFYRHSGRNGQTVSSCTARIVCREPEESVVEGAELIFFGPTLDLADGLRIGQTLRARGVLKKGAWLYVHAAEVVDEGSGPTFREFVASRPAVS